MTDNLAEKLRHATTTILAANKAAEVEKAAKQRQVEIDREDIHNVRQQMQALLSELNHIGAILWNTTYPEQAIAEGEEIYRLHPDCRVVSHRSLGVMRSRATLDVRYMTPPRHGAMPMRLDESHERPEFSMDIEGNFHFCHDRFSHHGVRSVDQFIEVVTKRLTTAGR